jgi:hypothetical protein
MSRAQCLPETLAEIYSAWCQGFPPLQVAKALRLVPLTVITEYVRLDDIHRAPQTKLTKDLHETETH